MDREALVLELEKKAVLCRKNVLRMIAASHHGHIGPAYSCMDIVTTLYFYAMNADPARPEMEDRDILILSAGHKGMAQYAALGERGYFDKAIFDSYGADGSRIPGHPDKNKLPGIEASTGSLGHGLNLACGYAMALKKAGKKARVFVIMGDGELAEGSNWEAAAVAAKYGLDNLVLFVDNNNLQIGGHANEVMSFEPIDGHFAAFGWATRAIDGNCIAQLVDAMDDLPLEAGKPNLVLAHTIKGKGFSEAEDKASWHFWGNASAEDLARANAELDERMRRLREKCEKL